MGIKGGVVAQLRVQQVMRLGVGCGGFDFVRDIGRDFGAQQIIEERVRGLDAAAFLQDRDIVREAREAFTGETEG